MYKREDMTQIPMKSRGDDKCYLPERYRKACLDLHEKENWTEGCNKCWMRILGCIQKLGKYIFVVNWQLKPEEFDWSQLDEMKETKSSKPDPENSPFSDW